jgi:hypothetical protein
MMPGSLAKSMYVGRTDPYRNHLLKEMDPIDDWGIAKDRALDPSAPDWETK